MILSIFPPIIASSGFIRAKDQIRMELKRLDIEVTVELTDVRFQNGYSTLALCASGNDTL